MRIVRFGCWAMLASLAIGCTLGSHKEGSQVSSEQTTVSSVQRSMASLQDQVQSLDPNKKTVCSITINSDHEIRSFRSALGEQKFNYVELVPQERGQANWFQNACRSGVKCDVLVVSGHFAGRFFGIDDYPLELQELEEASCRSDCGGILDNPKEVFLFGCNTLAGKLKDSRTPAEYIETLVREDRYTRATAEAVAAFRYSPLGEKNEARIRRVFKGATKIYGFDSKAPLGPEAEQYLAKYFRSKPNYTAHLDQVRPNSTNPELIRSMGSRSIVEATGWGDVSRSPVCYLNNPAVDTFSKVQWIREALDNPKSRLENMIYIERYLREMENQGYVWSDRERQLWSEIERNSEVKKDVAALLANNLNEMLGLKIMLANLMRSLKWWNDEEYSTGIRQIMGKALQNNVSDAEVKRVCLASVDVHLTLRDLPSNAMTWSKNLLNLVACVKVTDTDIHEALMARVMKERSLESRVEAIDVLRSVKVSSASVQKSLIELASDPSQSDHLRWRACRVFGRAQRVAPEIIFQLLKLMENEPSLFVATRDSLNDLRPQNEEFLREVLRIGLAPVPTKMASAAFDILAVSAQAFPEIQMELVKQIAEDRADIAHGVDKALVALEPKDPRVYAALESIVNNTDPKRDWSRSRALKVLGRLKYKDPHFVQLLLDLVKNDSSESIRADAAELLGFAPKEHVEVEQTLLAQTQIETSPRVRTAIESGMLVRKNVSEELKRKMARLYQEAKTEADRIYYLRMLARSVPNAEDLQKIVVDSLQSPSNEIRQIGQNGIVDMQGPAMTKTLFGLLDSKITVLQGSSSTPVKVTALLVLLARQPSKEQLKELQTRTAKDPALKAIFDDHIAKLRAVRGG